MAGVALREAEPLLTSRPPPAAGSVAMVEAAAFADSVEPTSQRSPASKIPTAARRRPVVGDIDGCEHRRGRRVLDARPPPDPARSVAPRVAFPPVIVSFSRKSTPPAPLLPLPEPSRASTRAGGDSPAAVITVRGSLGRRS